MSQRKELVAAVVSGTRTVAAACREFGVSRKTAYKWLARFRAEGEAGLAERSRRPHCAPRQVGSSVERLVVQARLQHPAWGGRKLKRWLENQGHTGLPAVSTLTAILRRQGLLDEQECVKHRAFVRFERPQPNELWQMDFKGDFEVGARRCYPLTVLDDHSRFLVGLRACANIRRQTVQSQLTELFRTFGLPEQMLMDNGAPWGGSAQGRYTGLTLWLLRLNVNVTHGRPYHPQTQGKDERLHRTLQAEVLTRTTGESLSDWQGHFDQWRTVYNSQRPHEALKLDTPASRYRPSDRPYPERLPELVYPAGASMRQVSSSGTISLHGRTCRVGKAFRNERLGVLADPLKDGRWNIYYGSICVHSVDFRLD